MKRSLLFIFISLLITSCSSQKFLVIQNNKYQSQFNYHEVIILSSSNDFFKVYKINDCDYAFLPYKTSDKSLNLDDLPNCIIISENEVEEFRQCLQNFIKSCENNRNTPFVTEVMIRKEKEDSIIKFETTDDDKTNIPGDLNNYPFLIQATSRRTFTDRLLEITLYSNIKNKKYSIYLNDVKNLLNALNK